MKPILEFIATRKASKPVKQYKYNPQTKEELIKAIETEFDADNYNLNCIDTSDITDMSFLFNSAQDGVKPIHENIEVKIDVSEWDTSNVTDMKSIFQGRHKFCSDLSKWDVSKVKDMSYMFCGCENFDSDITKWDTRNVRNISFMFFCCGKLRNQDLSKWKMNNINNMGSTFYYCKHLDFDISKWKVTNNCKTDYIFYNSPMAGTYGYKPTIEHGHLVKLI